MKYTYSYGYHKSMTVQVYADIEDDPEDLARDKLDDEYADAGMEPPVSWTLTLIKVEE